MEYENVPVNLFFKTSSKLFVLPRYYVCLFFRQNGGRSLLQEEAKPIPQLFHMGLWIWEKKPSGTNLFPTMIRPAILEFSIRVCQIRNNNIDVSSIRQKPFTLEAFYDILQNIPSNESRRRLKLIAQAGM